MLFNHDFVNRQWMQIVLTKLFLRALAITLFLCSFTIMPAVGQGYTYSDAWVSDSMVPEGTIYEAGAYRAGPLIYGCGITELNYSSGGHYAEVNTMLQSPSGASTNGSNNGQTSARVDVALLWHPSEAGEYVVNSTHASYCPMINEYSNSSTGPWIVVIGGSKNTTRRVAPRTFTTIVPCDILCRLDGYIGPYPEGPFNCAYLYIPSANGHCLRGSVVLYGNEPCEPCANYFAPIILYF